MSRRSVLLVGAGGRMGRFTSALLARSAAYQVVGEVGRGQDLALECSRLRPELAIDFTQAGLGARHARTLLEAGVRPLVGTSGVRPEEVTDLDARARELGLGGLVVPNFCLGIVLQQRFALEALRHYQSVEIVEEHHQHKTDAPSGTALDTARRLAAAAGVAPGAIPIHSLRLAGLYSNQSVHFGGPGEVLSLTHRNYGLEAFGPGILTGLRYLPDALGVGVGLERALESTRA